MGYMIKALDDMAFTQFYGLSDDALAEFGILSYISDNITGYPCRVSLTNAAPGERLLLLNYEHLPVDSPYRASHAIFVKDGAKTSRVPANQVPDMLSNYLLSVRSYDHNDMMVDADVVEGVVVEEMIMKMLSDDAVKYIHLHTARRGCFMAEVLRA